MITRQGLWCSFGLAVCLAVAGCSDSARNSGLNDLTNGSESAPQHVAQKPIAESPATPVDVPPVKSAPGENITSVQPADEPSDPVSPATSAPGEVDPSTSQLPATAPSAVTVSDNAVTPASPATPATPVSTVPRKVQVLIKEKSFVIDQSSGALRVPFDSLDLLKVLNMVNVTEDAVSLMPAWQRALDGKEIIIRGFMRPQFSETGLTDFLLVPDIKYCCFGPSPAIYDLVEVHLAEGTTSNYIELRPFDVVGTFHIKMRFEDGLAQGLYSIDDARIIQK